MFGKKSTEGNKNDKSNLRSSQGKNPDGHNVIIASTEVEGTVKAQNDFRIDGQFKGDLSCEAKVIIGEGGRFEGDVTCVNAVIKGEFQGNLHVTEVLYVKETAVIHGEVTTGKLVVQSGSIFEVNCKMTDQKSQGVKVLEAGKERMKNPAS